MTKLRLGIIGCGAITKLGYLPAADKMDNAQVTVLVDKDRSRAEWLAHQYNVPHVAEDYSHVLKKADAAIVALPNHLHAPVSIDLLDHGIHTLVEKPMAISAAECDTMILAAQRGHAVLAVGHVRRFMWSAQFTKAVLNSNLLGPIMSFDVQEGFVYNWPVASDFFLRKETAGGGVLIDTGVHTLDSLLWWLGNVVSFEYFDNSVGGVESDCELHLEMENGVKGFVHLSRTRRLRNTAIIRGEKASLETHLYSNQVRLYLKEAAPEVLCNWMADTLAAQCEQSFVDTILAQLTDWVDAIRDGNSPRVSGGEARRPVALIEACYARRKPMALPWVTPLMQMSATLEGDSQ